MREPDGPRPRRTGRGSCVPPHDIQAEESLLGAMMLDSEAIAVAADWTGAGRCERVSVVAALESDSSKPQRPTWSTPRSVLIGFQWTRPSSVRLSLTA